MNEADSPALFTVLLPVHRPPALLPFAIASVRAQRETRFTLCIICDGTPPETVRCAQEFAAQDARIKVFAFEKGERHGEAHRHHVLQDANTEFVAQIGDDDIWFPGFLDEMKVLLADADFGNLPQTELHPDGSLIINGYDLGHPAIRTKMLQEKWNLAGPTFVGYRLSAYRQLPDGWSPSSPDLFTDLNMWRKFLAVQSFRFATRFSVQGVKFAADKRPTITLTERANEIAAFADRVSDPHARMQFQIEALELLAVKQRNIHDWLQAEFISDLQNQVAQSELAAHTAKSLLEKREIEAQSELTQIRSEIAAMHQEHTRRLQAINEIIENLISSRSWPLVKRVTAIGPAIDRIRQLTQPNRN